MVQQANGKIKLTTTEEKARALVNAGCVRLTEGGASVTNAEGFTYRVDFNLGGRPNCQCRGFEYRGWCKHLTAAYMARAEADDELAAQSDDDAYAEMSQEEWDRYCDALLDAGLSTGTMESAVYALTW
mgnify:CR=1 FL=1